MTEEQKQEQPESYIQIVFKEYGSAIFDLSIGEQVTPIQIYAVMGYLKVIADNQVQAGIAEQLAKQAQQSIAVPQGKNEILTPQR